MLFDFDSKYIEFFLAEKHKPNSWVIDIFTKSEDENDPITLGQIRYYARWRQYSFYPYGGMVFEKTCLRDILEVLKMMNELQRVGVKPENPQQKLVMK